MGKEQLSDQQKYDSAFEVRNFGWRSLRKKELALKYALDIRKFEIDLYWKRATYFWTLIAAILTGFGVTMVDDKYAKISIVLSCIAIVLCWAWVLVNRGSKHWQENWEYHVDLLEDDIIGSLYKTVLSKQNSKPLIGAKAMSVSKINLLVSWFMLVVCGSLLVYAWFKFQKQISTMVYFFDFWFCFGFTAISLIACSLIYHFGKSGLFGKRGSLDGTKLKMTTRHSIIVTEKRADQARAEQTPSSA